MWEVKDHRASFPDWQNKLKAWGGVYGGGVGRDLGGGGICFLGQEGGVRVCIPFRRSEMPLQK